MGWNRVGERFARIGLVAAMMAAAGAAHGQTEDSIVPLGGSLAGQDLAAGGWAVQVEPGAPLEGSVRIQTNHLNRQPGVNAQLGYAWTWGNRQSAFRAAAQNLPAGPFELTVNLSLTAPDAPGTHYILIAFHNAFAIQQVFSGTNWDGGAAVWNDGNDLADIAPEQIAEARQNGFVEWPFLSRGAMKNEPLALLPIEVRVAAPGPDMDGAFLAKLLSGWNRPDGVDVLEDGRHTPMDLYLLGQNWHGSIVPTPTNTPTPTHTPVPPPTPPATNTPVPTPTPRPVDNPLSVENYHRLEPGNRWDYVYQGMRMSVTAGTGFSCGGSTITEHYTIDNTTAHYSFENGRLSILEMDAGGLGSLSFCSDPLSVGAGVLTANSSFSSSITFQGVRINFSLRYLAAGRVSVPYGTFNNCLKAELRINVAGQSFLINAWVIAPGVGKIQQGVFRFDTAVPQFVGYANLTNINFQPAGAFVPAPPTPTPRPGGSSFAGTYAIQISGDDFGSGTLQVDAAGRVTGGIQTAEGFFQASGTVAANGSMTLQYTMDGMPVGTASGRLNADGTGSGTWTDLIWGDTGTWTARKTG